MPDAARLTETVLKDNKVMQTRMVRKRDTFAIIVQVPPGTMADFSFLIAKTDEGTTVDIRHEREESGRALSRIVSFDGQIEIQSQWKRGPLNVEF